MTDATSYPSFSPFETGAVVTGEKFIGRHELVKKCMRRLKGGNSVALRGIPRIGKTSLARRLLESGNWPEKNVIRVYVDLEGCASFFHFWRDVAIELKNAYAGENIDSNLQNLFHAVEAAGDDYEKINRAVKAVLMHSQKKGIHTILCIDEFDSVVRIFGDSTQTASVCYYQFLRELITNRYLYGLSCIILLRRSLFILTKNAEGVSQFTNAIETIPVHGFDDGEMTAFREYAAKHGLALSAEDWAVLVEQAGRSPFMLSKSAAALLDRESGNSVQQTLKSYEAAHYDYFKDLLKYLQEDNNKDLRRMIQLFIGPKYNLNQNDINELIHSGYIKLIATNGREAYETLSERFQQYLAEETRQGLDLEIWPLLEVTHKNLRNTIEAKMYAKYGDKWEDELLQKAQSKTAGNQYFLDLKKIKMFWHPPQRLIDVISFLELMNIIIEYRGDLFTDVFDGWSIKDIKNNFKPVHDARKPLAHFDGHLLTNLEVEEADLACKKILEGLNATVMY